MDVTLSVLLYTVLQDSALSGVSEGACSGRAWFRAHQTQISTGWVLDQAFSVHLSGGRFSIPVQLWDAAFHSVLYCPFLVHCLLLEQFSAFHSSREIYPLTRTDSLSCLLMTFCSPCFYQGKQSHLNFPPCVLGFALFCSGTCKGTVLRATIKNWVYNLITLLWLISIHSMNEGFLEVQSKAWAPFKSSLFLKAPLNWIGPHFTKLQ